MRGFADLPPALRADTLRYVARYLEAKKPAIARWYASKSGMLVDHCLREIEQTESGTHLTFWMIQGAIWQTMRGVSRARKSTMPRELGPGLDWLIARLHEHADRLMLAELVLATR